MSGVLIDEHEAACIFHEDVQSAEDTEQTEVFVVGRVSRGRWGVSREWEGRWGRRDGRGGRGRVKLKHETTAFGGR